jgi:phospho-N-acetylmuramoyl-pentapeptide-transferase
MLHYFLVPLADQFQLFNVFRYITFRVGGAMLTALIIAFIIGPPLIRWLKLKQGKGQPIREDGPQRHILEKKGTPTMGGFMILIALTVSTLLWADLTNLYVWTVLGVTLGFGMLGFWDDYLKVTKRSSDGVSGRFKLLVQGIISIAAVIVIMELHRTMGGPASPKLSGTISLPFLKDLVIPLGALFIVFGLLVIVGASNAVNLTDGLDGLAIVPVMVAASSFGVIAYVVGRADFTTYLQLLYVPGTGCFAVLCGRCWAGLDPLNAPPAMVFMAISGLRWAACWERWWLRQHEIVLHHRRALVLSRAGDDPGCVLQAHGQARVQDGANPSPFRAARLARTHNRHPVLDHFGDLGADRACHLEDQVSR